jgi:phosphoserine phosphatase
LSNNGQSTTLYFVRHGETDYNRRGVIQGRKVNSDLNALGREQAEALGQRFRDTYLDVIYSSPLKRALDTAQTVRMHHPETELHLLEDLEEMSWGRYEGEEPGEVLDRFLATLFDRWSTGDFAYRVEEGESILDVQERALRALDYIVSREAGKSVLVVTHGRFIRVLLSSVLGEYGLDRMQDIKHSNTAVNHVTCRGGRYEAVLLNCTAHLERTPIPLID